MYAIVEIAGQQYKVQKDQQIFVHRLEGKEGSKVEFDNVLLTGDGDKINVGAPAVKGITVSAKILEHLKGDKVIVFKKKRRKGYKVRNGHRQYLTKIEIAGIGASSSKSSASAKKEEKPAAKAQEKAAAEKPAAKAADKKVAEAKKAAPKKESKPATAKTESKPKTAPKAAAKKAPAKKEATDSKKDKKDDKAK